MDISNLIQPHIILSMSTTHQHAINFTYAGRERFPEAARGFLYCHVPVKNRPLAGELRFRTTHHADPLEFHNGRDLLLPSGLPWSSPVITLSPLRQPAILEMLHHDGLYDKTHLNFLSRLGDSLQRNNKSSIFIHDLDQLFLYDFSQETLQCRFVGETSVSKWRKLAPFAHQLTRTGYTTPFLGEFQSSYPCILVLTSLVHRLCASTLGTLANSQRCSDARFAHREVSHPCAMRPGLQRPSPDSGGGRVSALSGSQRIHH